MTMNRTLSVLVLLLCSLMAKAQVVRVVDQDDQRPLEGVVITGDDPASARATDARGRAAIDGLTGDTLTFTALGYADMRMPRTALASGEAAVTLHALPFTLREAVVSVNRWEQGAERVPDRITVMRPRDVALYNPGTAADMLQRSGEVFMQKSQLGGGSPMIRGFAANRLLIVVDGVRMNNAIYRAGNLQNIISMDANAIERAEVVHGPGAMTYGSDAIGGVMDFHMLRPRFSQDSSLLLRGGAAARYGSAANEFGGHLNIGLGGRRIAFVGSATFNRFGDLRAGSIGPADYRRPWSVETVNGVDSMVMNVDPDLQLGSGYDNINLFGKLAFHPVDALEIGLNVYHSTTSDVPRYDRLIELRPSGTPRSAEWYYGPQEWTMGALTVKHTAARGPWSTARLSVAYQSYAESRNDRNFRNTSLRTQAEQVTGVYVNLDMERELGRRGQLFFGGEYVTNEVTSTGRRVDQVTGEETVINSRYPDGSTWSTGSVYVGAMFDATERFTLTAGLRFNWSALDCMFDTTLFPYPATTTSLSNTALTGNLGLVYRPGTDWKFALDLSSGFRAPNIDDIGKVFDSEPGAVIVPNPDLAPEHAYSAELGVEKVVTDHVRLRGSGYYVLLDNAMVRRPFSLNGQDSILYDGEPSRVDAIQNAAQATVVGCMMAVEARLWSGLGLDLRLNWQDGVEQDDDNTTDVPLRHSPPPFGSAGLSWQKGRVRARLFADISDGFSYDDLPPSEQAKTAIYAKDANGDPYAPSWYSLNLNGSYQVNKVLLVSAGVENITDQRYRPYSSGISAPGRNFTVGLRASF